MTDLLLGILGGVLFPYLAISATLPAAWIFGTEGMKHPELFQLIFLPGFIFWVLFILLVLKKGISK